MNIASLECSMRLPAPLDQPPAGRRCARHRWKHRDGTRHAAPTSSIDARAGGGSGLGRSLPIGVGVQARPTQLESP